MWRPPATAACCSGRCARSCGRARLSTCLTIRATCASGMPPLGSRSLIVLPAAYYSRLFQAPFRAVLPCHQLTLHAKPHALSLLWSDLLTSLGTCTLKVLHVAIGTSWARCLAREALGLCARQQSGRRGGATHAKPSRRCPTAPAYRQCIGVNIPGACLRFLPSCGEPCAC